MLFVIEIVYKANWVLISLLRKFDKWVKRKNTSLHYKVYVVNSHIMCYLRYIDNTLYVLINKRSI